jgi:SAM-dependent methyltransferase
MTDYTIEQGPGVRERMNLLAAVHAPTTLALLDSLGVAEGARCIDLGCGGGHVTMELGRRAGPAGCAVGIDLDEALLECARRDAAVQRLDNVTFQVAAAEDLAEAGFDLAFARFLLSHLRDPARVAGLMVAGVRSRGFVVVEDTEFSGCFTYPTCPSYDRWVGWYRETVRRTGGDADLGPRLPALLRSVGVTEIGVRVAQHAYLDGPHKRLQELSMDKQKAAVVAAGVASADDYDAAQVDLQAFTADPTTLIAGPRIIQAWGRRA